MKSFVAGNSVLYTTDILRANMMRFAIGSKLNLMALILF